MSFTRRILLGGVMLVLWGCAGPHPRQHPALPILKGEGSLALPEVSPAPLIQPGKGRAKSPVEELARSLLIPILMPESQRRRALEALRTYIRNHPEDPVALAYWGMILSEEEGRQLPAAARAMARALAELPEERRDLRALTCFYLGSLHLREERYRSAVTLLAKAWEEAPRDPRVIWNLWLACEGLGEIPEEVPSRVRAFFPRRLDMGPPPPRHARLPRFRDVTGEAGIRVVDRGKALAWGDYDGDGWVDLALAGSGDTDRLHLFRNQRDGTFREVTEAVNLAEVQAFWGIYFLDADRDGRPDLLVTAPKTRLFRNTPSGFREVTRQAGLEGCPAWGPAALADIDGDGDLDFFVSHLPPGMPGRNALYRNRGDGTFDEVGKAAGVVLPGSNWHAVFWDWDEDGDPDLYITRMRSPNALLVNKGDGTFEPLPAAGVDRPVGMAKAPVVADFDQDGRADLFVNRTSSAFHSLGARLGMAQKPAWPEDHPFLYRNSGGGRFRDISAEAGLDLPIGGMGAQGGDIDNDGYPDLYLGTGSMEMVRFDPDVVLWNDRGKRFYDVAHAVGLAGLGKGHGIGFCDYDRDGWLDAAISVGGMRPADREPSRLYHNEGVPGRHWLALRLRGTRSNPEGIGARVELRLPDGSSCFQYRTGSNGFATQNGPHLHFGLGARDRVAEVIVDWPSGKRERFPGVAADGYWLAEEGTGALRPERVER